MFEKLQQSARLSDSGNFPYLRSHPMTTERMGDMQQRLLIQQHMTKFTPQTEPSLQHAMMAARARVLAEPGVDVLRQWAAEPQASSFATFSESRQIASLYAAILANIKLRDFARASEQKNKLKTIVAADLIALEAIQIIAIDISLATGDIATASTLAAELAAKKTLSRAELFATAQVQIANQQAPAAAQKLQIWLATKPTDAPAWQLLAKAYGAANQPLRAIRADAEAQVALLDYTAALDRFKAAQDWVRANSSTGASTQVSRDFMEESIVDVRTRQVQELLRQQIKDEKESK